MLKARPTIIAPFGSRYRRLAARASVKYLPVGQHARAVDALVRPELQMPIERPGGVGIGHVMNRNAVLEKHDLAGRDPEAATHLAGLARVDPGKSGDVSVLARQALERDARLLRTRLGRRLERDEGDAGGSQHVGIECRCGYIAPAEHVATIADAPRTALRYFTYAAAPSRVSSRAAR